MRGTVAGILKTEERWGAFADQRRRFNSMAPPQEGLELGSGYLRTEHAICQPVCEFKCHAWLQWGGSYRKRKVSNNPTKNPEQSASFPPWVNAQRAEKFPSSQDARRMMVRELIF